MDGWIICCDGMDIVVHIACNDSQYSGTWYVVYFGGWIVIHDWCDILSVAANEVFTCGLAPVCNRGQCMFLLCGAVRVYIGFVRVLYHVV